MVSLPVEIPVVIFSFITVLSLTLLTCEIKVWKMEKKLSSMSFAVEKEKRLPMLPDQRVALFTEVLAVVEEAAVMAVVGVDMAEVEAVMVVAEEVLASAAEMADMVGAEEAEVVEVAAVIIVENLVTFRASALMEVAGAEEEVVVVVVAAAVVIDLSRMILKKKILQVYCVYVKMFLNCLFILCTINN